MFPVSNMYKFLYNLVSVREGLEKTQTLLKNSCNTRHTSGCLVFNRNRNRDWPPDNNQVWILVCDACLNDYYYALLWRTNYENHQRPPLNGRTCPFPQRAQALPYTLLVNNF